MPTLSRLPALRRRVPLLALAFAAAGVASLAPGCRAEKGGAGAGAISARPTQAQAQARAGAPGSSSTGTGDGDVPRTPRAPGGQRPVIWIGLDGLDWELLDRFAADGTMPNWKRLTSEGATARLRSFIPILSPILWTTAATGVSPDVHRVLDFQETDPKTGAKVPISGLSRAIPAVWNVASAAGRKVGVVGWWATHPAEEVHGFFISDHASPILFDRLPLSGAAYPPALESGIARVIARDGQVSDADLAALVAVSPAEIAQARRSGAGLENRIIALARILSATRVSHWIARDLYDREHPDLLALYLEGTDEVGHVFAAATPPKLPCASEADVEKYGRVVPGYYAEIDRLLGQWMKRAQEDGATLLVHSDHGFKWGDDRPCGLESGNWSTAAFWHRLDGVFAAWGARVRSGGPRGDVRIFDVAPTILSLLDLPPDRRMPGKPAAFAFRDVAARPPADDFAGVDVRHVSAEPMSPQEASEYSKKLLALGYLTGSETRPLAPSGGNRPGMTEGAWNNLGLYRRDSENDPKGAKAAFEKSLALRPDYYSPMYNLAVSARMQGKTKEAEDWLFRSLAALPSDPAQAIAGWAREYEKGGKAAAAASLLNRAAGAYPRNEVVQRELAMLRYRSHDCPGAARALSPFDAATKDPHTLNELALFATCRGDREAVLGLLRRSLALEPAQPEISRMLSVVEAAR